MVLMLVLVTLVVLVPQRQAFSCCRVFERGDPSCLCLDP